MMRLKSPLPQNPENFKRHRNIW